MKHINISVVNAFSMNGAGGNPAGILFDADDLGTDQKQMIAAAAGFPETAFVSSSTVADYKLDFFYSRQTDTTLRTCNHSSIFADAPTWNDKGSFIFKGNNRRMSLTKAAIHF